MKYFIVFQNKSFTVEKRKGILWAPQFSKDGGPPVFHWENMTRCQPGDVVFSVVNNRIVSRGIVKAPAITTKNPYNHDLWTDTGWLVKLDYNYAINSIRVQDHIDDLRPHLPHKYSPFNEITGKGNQGYLYAISNALGRVIDNLIIDVVHDIDVKSIYDLNDDDQVLVNALFASGDTDEQEAVLIEETPPVGTNKPQVKTTRVHGKKIDYIEKARRDLEQGIKAEQLVVIYEKQYLTEHGRTDLADKVKWVSKEADGFGYDVLSFDLDGKEKYIEVKSTRLGKNAPFEISSNEVQTSEKHPRQYWIYRVYHIDDDVPRVYKYYGTIADNFELEPSSYRAYFK